jgi:hypothetical protein
MIELSKECVSLAGTLPIYKGGLFMIPLAKNILNIIKGRSFFSPYMQMNPYNLNRLSRIMQRHGVRDLYVEYIYHTGYLGAVLYFKKPKKI